MTLTKANLFNNLFRNQTLINENNVEIPVLTEINDVYVKIILLCPYVISSFSFYRFLSLIFLSL